MSILNKIYFWMTNHSITRWILHIIKQTRIVYLIFYFISFNHPKQKMESERHFFLEHAQLLKEAYDSLDDDKSRFLFENILKYRITYDFSELKRSGLVDNLKNQYYVPELSFSDHEIIVDCGAYTGDTAKFFYNSIPGCRVIALEPDEKNFMVMKKLKLEGLKLINCGAWSEDTTLSFSNGSGGTSAGKISESGDTKIEVRALDNLPECQSATYIKMDIEGAELEALKGAEKIIKKNRPKLAICIYHKPQDFYEIPLYIKKLNPDYKLFIHHHLPYTSDETVLYAV